jgi:hypothetical protein
MEHKGKEVIDRMDSSAINQSVDSKVAKKHKCSKSLHLALRAPSLSSFMSCLENASFFGNPEARRHKRRAGAT